MPESTQELQRQEITVLRSIYADDFVETPPSNVWKGATRLHEFTIRVPHPDSENVYLHLHTRFPKTYPTLAVPIFAIQPPLKGVTPEHITCLIHEAQGEALRNKGSETVFQAISAMQDWLALNIVPPTEGPGSLALEMNQRALEEERARKQREAAAEAEAYRRAAAEAEELAAQIKVQQEAQLKNNKLRSTPRKRVGSNATAVDANTGDTPTETFPEEMEISGVKFRSVKIFHPRKESLGTRYLAEPICDDVHATLPLELFVVTFGDPYYASGQGRKKLQLLASSIHNLTTLRHANILSTFAVKLSMPGNPPVATAVPVTGMPAAVNNTYTPKSTYNSTVPTLISTTTGPPQLVILCEERPRVSLEDVMRDGEIRGERAREYLLQILSALNELHAINIVHQGITPRCIGLCTPRNHTLSKTVKLGRVNFYTRLLDLHRSNPFGPGLEVEDDPGLPDAWQLKEVVQSPLSYTRARDLHAVGVVLLRMLLGWDVTERFVNVNDALNNASLPMHLHQAAHSLLIPNKKNHASCLSILADLAETSFSNGTSNNSSTMKTARSRSGSIPITPGPPTNVFGRHNMFMDLRTPQPTGNGMFSSRSPEVDYPLRTPMAALFRRKQASRWKDDYEELELLGKGAFGSVVKARNKYDSRIYAVKKVRLRTRDRDNKIFREVEALSGLSHRFIVRYYTTWIESDEPTSTANSEGSSSDRDDYTDTGHAPYVEDDEGTEDGMTSVPDSDSTSTTGSTRNHDLRTDFDDNLALGEFSDGGGGLSNGSTSRGSFPSIHFEGSSSPVGSDLDDDDSDDAAAGRGLFAPITKDNVDQESLSPLPTVARTLYIQMEFVERQTLKERVDEGISEDEAWRLFQQILDALVHMGNLGILHRDIKLTNIFIDAKNNCKVGDFGLATSSLASVDTSHLSPKLAAPDADMTLEVGTRLYIAPEVMHSKKRGPRNHTKADLYSLGIVFFEMNHTFTTMQERIIVLEDLRKPEIIFPATWSEKLTRQREIITMLLQHDPDNRPTALELSQSHLLPPRLEDEYFKGALRMMTKPDSPHYQAVLTALFTQPPRPARSVLYDLESDLPEHAALNYIVHDRLAAIFRLHGAVDMEAPLLMPVTSTEDRKNNQATFLDRHGEVVALPINGFLPFARLASRSNIRRIKRYHIGDIYKSNALAGHPKYNKAAVFDIITPDLDMGPSAAAAEIIAIANTCLNSFPTMSQAYDVHISHSQIVDIALERVPSAHRNEAIEILNQTKSSVSQRRAHFIKIGLLRSTADELEILTDCDEDLTALMARLEKVSPALAAAIQPAVDEIKTTIRYARLAGVTRPILFAPLMLGNRAHFKDGVVIEVVRRNKRNDVLAAGGRYDHLIPRHSALKTGDQVCALGIQFAVEKITSALASYQSSSVKALIKEQRSFGFWSPRRCDVYVLSYHAGFLQDRLEIVAHLWQHGISADIMYEAALEDAEHHESHVDLCVREGILFAVYPPRTKSTREKGSFKIKSILKGTEYEVSRVELVSWLHHQISEQKRTDVSISGAVVLNEGTSPLVPSKDPNAALNVTMLLPTVDAKKQRKPIKHLFNERAIEKSNQLKTEFLQGMPMIAVDVSVPVMLAMVKSSAWVTEDEAWRGILALFPPQHTAYAHSVRESVSRRKAEGHLHVLIYAVKEDQAQLLSFSA